MKKYVSRPLIAVATLFSTSAGAIEFEIPVNHRRVPEVEILDFVSVRDLSEAMLQDILQGRLPSIAIEFPKEEELPLEMIIGGDLISLVKTDDAPTYIKFNKSLYLRYFNGSLYLSSDLHQWTPFEKFVTGTLKILFSIEESKGPVITLGADLYERISSEKVE